MQVSEDMIATVKAAAKEAVDNYIKLHPATSMLINGPTHYYHQQFLMIAQFASLSQKGSILPMFSNTGLGAKELGEALKAILTDAEVMVISVDTHVHTGDLQMTAYTRRCGVHQGLARDYGASGIPGLVPADFMANLANRAASLPAVDDDINVVYLNHPFRQRDLFNKFREQARANAQA